jgi:hypothetical protein
VSGIRRPIVGNFKLHVDADLVAELYAMSSNDESSASPSKILHLRLLTISTL